MSRTRRLTKIAVMVALASALHVVEALIPVPYLMPGAKLGLANIVALLLIMEGSFLDGIWVNVIRAFLGSLLSGTFLAVTFFLSFSGAFISAVAMVLSKLLIKDRVSTVGISVVGAIFHNLAQLLVASLFMQQIGVLFYLPYLLFFAIPTGIFVGLVTARILPYANRF